MLWSAGGPGVVEHVHIAFVPLAVVSVRMHAWGMLGCVLHICESYSA